MLYQSVCFDIDGTLYKPWQLKANLVRLFFCHPVLGLRFNKVRANFRKIEKDDEFESLSDFIQREVWVAKKLGIKLTYSDLKEKIYPCLSRVMLRLKPQKGLEATFKWLKERGVRVGVLSDFPVSHKLITLGIAQYVDFACDCNDTLILKPDKRAFEYLLNCGKIQGKVLYVGDKKDNDIEGAKNAGLDAALIGPDGFTWLEFDRWLKEINA